MMEKWRNFAPALRVTGFYLAFGLLWIVGSDSVVQFLAQSESEHATLQTYKGSAFVIASAALIGTLVYRETRRRTRVRRLLRELVDLSPEPTCVRRAEDDVVVEVNQDFARAFDTSRSNLVGTSLTALEADLRELTDASLDGKLADGDQTSNYRQTVCGSDDHSIELLVSSRTVDLGSERYVCTFASDLTDLLEAYDETVRGWARALELRDEETHAHTLRVTNATVALARQLGVPDDEIPHIRRGALLHDIGKLGIPDAILHKTGDLDDEEWNEIQKHPAYARELLEAVEFLRPAIDIPYCHHEKWDGSGYPEGLSGRDIPLSARIFAVVDVWDALLSDRPYRDPWSRKDVREHLRSEKGTHFQPEIVDAFLELEAEHSASLRDVDAAPVKID